MNYEILIFFFILLNSGDTVATICLEIMNILMKEGITNEKDQ